MKQPLDSYARDHIQAIADRFIQLYSASTSLNFDYAQKILAKLSIEDLRSEKILNIVSQNINKHSDVHALAVVGFGIIPMLATSKFNLESREEAQGNELLNKFMEVCYPQHWVCRQSKALLDEGSEKKIESIERTGDNTDWFDLLTDLYPDANGDIDEISNLIDISEDNYSHAALLDELPPNLTIKITDEL